MTNKICSRCVMDDSDQSIVFDKNGYCNYCTDVLRRMPTEYFPNESGKQQLDKMMEKVKADGKGFKYDCMVGVSGGLDSSYVLFLGKKYGLRMLCVHVDDGLDTETAKSNIAKLCKKCEADLIIVRPDIEQYKDITRSLFLSGVPNLALAQDNLLIAALRDTAKKYHIRYSLSGANFSMESILQRGTDGVNSGDKKHLVALHKQFGKVKINKLRFSNMFENYIEKRYFSRTKTLYPLNYINYRLDNTITELKSFCDYEYYGGKHYESILTRFLQCYYLPTYFDFDKRKSHFSSLIVTEQMTRQDALERLAKPAYNSDELLQSDIKFLANYLEMSESEFRSILAQPKHKHSDYPTSVLNKIAPIARKFRRLLG